MERRGWRAEKGLKFRFLRVAVKTVASKGGLSSFEAGEGKPVKYPGNVINKMNGYAGFVIRHDDRPILLEEFHDLDPKVSAGNLDLNSGRKTELHAPILPQVGLTSAVTVRRILALPCLKLPPNSTRARPLSA